MSGVKKLVSANLKMLNQNLKKKNLACTERKNEPLKVDIQEPLPPTDHLIL